MIAPMAAADAPVEVAFIVMMAGPGVPGDQILLRQTALILGTMGLEPTRVEAVVESTREVYRLVNEGAEPDAIEAVLAPISEETLRAIGEANGEVPDGATGSTGVASGLAQMKSLWFRYFLSYDPRPTLARVRCPVLAINGEKDVQVDPKQNLPEVEKALVAGGNHRFKVVELPGLNHLFQPCTTGGVDEYAKIETTLDPAALKLIGDWVVEVTGS